MGENDVNFAIFQPGVITDTQSIAHASEIPVVKYFFVFPDFSGGLATPPSEGFGERSSMRNFGAGAGKRPLILFVGGHLQFLGMTSALLSKGLFFVGFRWLSNFFPVNW